MRRSEWTCCIQVPGSPRRSVCGRALGHEWAFENADNARIVTREDPRVVTCRTCAMASVTAEASAE